MSRGWATASACRLHVSLSCAFLFQIVSLQYVSRSSPPLAWSPLSSFLVVWSPSGDTRGPSVVFEAVDMACSGPLQNSHIADYVYDFCHLPDPDVLLSFACDAEHTSFHFGLCDHKFVICTICHSWQHAGVVHASSGRWRGCF